MTTVEERVTTLGNDLGAIQRRVAEVSAGTKQFDINKSLGLTREKEQYDKRLKALTNPTDYANQREGEWNKMTDAVKAYFENTINYLGEAGFDWEDSKEKAKELSRQFAAIERQKLELKFPTSANVIGAQRQVDLAFGASGAEGKFNPAEIVAAAQTGPIQPARKKSSSRSAKSSSKKM